METKRPLSERSSEIFSSFNFIVGDFTQTKVKW